MLYNKAWDKTEIKADPFALDSLIAWLEKQPADGIYCYTDHGRCLLGQYFSAMGYEKPYIYSDGLFEHGESAIRHRYPGGFNTIALESPRTFGAALERARKAAA